MSVQGYPRATWHPSPVFGHGSRPWNWQNIGRSGSSDIRQVIVHPTESAVGDKRGSLRALTNVPLDRGLNSAHYLVAEDGVYQLVDDRNQAWHGNQTNPYSIGVETVGEAGNPATWSPNIIANWGGLAGWLSWAYDIPLNYVSGAFGRPDSPIPDRAFVAHGAIKDSRSDPGEFIPWGEIRQAALAYLDQVPISEMRSGLDVPPQVQAERVQHPQWTEPPENTPPPPPPDEPVRAGMGGGLVLAVIAAISMWWFNR